MGRKPLLFGDFLFQKGLIKEKDSLTARHIQAEANKQIGQLAIKQKQLNAQNIQNLLQQKGIPRRKNGDITIDFKILTRKQVKDLLAYQKDYNFDIGDLFRYEGALGMDVLKEEIEKFASYRERRHSNGNGEK